MPYIFPLEFCEHRSFGNLAASNAEDHYAHGQRHFEIANETSEIGFAVRRELSMCDALTGLSNMRAFRSALTQRLADERAPFAVLYLNIDNFAALNRREGHARGDIVLRELAVLLKENLSPVCADNTSVARAHDDVFLVLLSDVSRDEALTTADDLQAAIETHIFNYDDERQANVTLSIGVAACPHDGATLDKLLARAAHHAHKQRDARKQRSTSFPFSIKPTPNVIPFTPRSNFFN